MGDRHTGPIAIKDEYGATPTLVADGRFRLPGGRRVHHAVVEPDGGGVFVILVCDPDMGRWFAHSEDKRLGLVQPLDDEVTCRDCQRVQRKVAARRTDTEGSDHD